MEKIKEKNVNPLIDANIKLICTKLFLSATCFILALIGGVKVAKAASLYISPASSSYTIGDTFAISIFVSSADQAMNAASGIISFSQEKLEVTSLSKSGSIVSLWVQEPLFSNSAGTINFEGIVLNPGFTGSAGKIITINFKAKTAGNASLIFSSGSILANDGQGTNILTGMSNGSYTIFSEAITPKKEEKLVIPKTKPTPKLSTEEKLSEAIKISKPEITSPTHPDQNKWHSNNDIEFKWELPYGVTGVSILLNDKQDSNSGPISDGLFSAKNYKDMEDGVWYLHLKLKSKAGWSEIEHFKIQIDSTLPKPFKIDVDTEKDMAWPILNFKAEDDVSGINRYEVKINGQDFTVNADKVLFTAPILEPGKHTAIVKAIDNAGNETIAVADFTIEPIEAPIIKKYPRELKSTCPLFISGIALPDVTVNIFIQNKKTEKIIKRTSQSDKDGKWHFIYQDGLTNGKYFVCAKAISPQSMKSELSNKVSILVTPTIFVKFGFWIINYFTAFVILLFFIILIIAFLAFWAGLIRNRLKKETDEAQSVLHKNLKDLKKLIEEEMTCLNKIERKDGHGKKRAKMKKTIKSRADFIEKKIAKEINDIKNLLK